MASIDKVKKGYRVRWRNPGRSAGSYTVEDKAQAERFRALAEVAEHEGRPWVPPAKQRPEGLDEPLDAAAVRYIRFIDGSLRDRTVTLYAENLGRVIPMFGRRGEPTVADLTADNLRALVQAWQREGRKPNTIAMRINAVHGLAKFLARGELRDQMEDVRAVKIRRPPPEAIRLGFAEADIVVEYLGRTGSNGRTFGMIARCSGLRANEILNMTWGMFQGLAGPEPMLALPHAITKGGESGRVLPVAPVLAAYLLSIRPEGVASSERVCGWKPNPSGAAKMIERAMRAAVEAGDLAEHVWAAGGRAHMLRGCFMQGLDRLGAKERAIEWLVLHKLDGVQGHYYNMEESARAAVALVPPLPTPAGDNVVPMGAVGGRQRTS